MRLNDKDFPIFIREKSLFKLCTLCFGSLFFCDLKPKSYFLIKPNIKSQNCFLYSSILSYRVSEPKNKNKFKRL